MSDSYQFKAGYLEGLSSCINPHVVIAYHGHLLVNAEQKAHVRHWIRHEISSTEFGHSETVALTNRNLEWRCSEVAHQFPCFFSSIICITGWWYTYPSEKYESQLGWWPSQYVEKSNMFQTTNQIMNSPCNVPIDSIRLVINWSMMNFYLRKCHQVDPFSIPYKAIRCGFMNWWPIDPAKHRQGAEGPVANGCPAKAVAKSLGTIGVLWILWDLMGNKQISSDWLIMVHNG